MRTPREDCDAEKLTVLSQHRQMGRRAVCKLHGAKEDMRMPDLIMCSRCGQNLSSEYYPAKHLQHLWGEGLLQSDATCYRCEPRELAKLKGKVLQCTLCGEEKESTAFTLTMQKRAAASVKGLRCKDCQMPACSSCGTRPEAALPATSAPKSVEEKKRYKCLQCAFPRCKVCGTEMTRQQRHTFQKRDAASQKEWTCSDCIDKAHNRPHR